MLCWFLLFNNRNWEKAGLAGKYSYSLPTFNTCQSLDKKAVTSTNT